MFFCAETAIALSLHSHELRRKVLVLSLARGARAAQLLALFLELAHELLALYAAGPNLSLYFVFVLLSLCLLGGAQLLDLGHDLFAAFALF